MHFGLLIKKVKKQNLDLNSQKILITSPYKIIQLHS